MSHDITEPSTLSFAGRLREAPLLGIIFEVEVGAEETAPRLRLRALARSFASAAGLDSFSADYLHVGRIVSRPEGAVLPALALPDAVAHRRWGDIADTPYARVALTKDGMPESFQLPISTVLHRYRDGDEHGWDREFDLIESEFTGKLDMIATSMQESGQHDPILLGPDGRVWDGHKRLTAAHRLLGWQSVVVSYHLDGEPLTMPA